MTSEAKTTSTVGEIVNLMSVDCQRLQDITGKRIHGMIHEGDTGLAQKSNI